MSRDDQAMITLTGVDLYSVHYFTKMCVPVYEQNKPFMDKEGRIIERFFVKLMELNIGRFISTGFNAVRC